MARGQRRAASKNEKVEEITRCGLRLSSPEPTFSRCWPASSPARSRPPSCRWRCPPTSDDKGNELVPSLSLEGAFFPQSQSWFGKSKDNLGETSNYWFEQVGKLALSGQAALDGYGTMYGKVSGILTATQRTDAAGSDVPGDTPERSRLGGRLRRLALGQPVQEQPRHRRGRPVLRPPALPGRIRLSVLGCRQRRWPARCLLDRAAQGIQAGRHRQGHHARRRGTRRLSRAKRQPALRHQALRARPAMGQRRPRQHRRRLLSHLRFRGSTRATG